MKGQGSIAAFGALGLLMAAVPMFAGDYFTGVGLSLLLYVALTQSWTVLSGMTGYVSLGHVVFYGIGGYIAALSWGSVASW